MTQPETIFRRLPAQLFRLFAGRDPQFYAGLVEFLDAEVFGVAGEMISRRAAIETVGEFIEREARDIVLEGETPLSPEESRDKDPRKYIAFYWLQSTGWLIEHRDRYRKIIDFDPEARFLLQPLLEIKSGDLRSYGGEILQILTLLKSVAEEAAKPVEAVDHSENPCAPFGEGLRSLTVPAFWLPGGLPDDVEPVIEKISFAEAHFSFGGTICSYGRFGLARRSS